MGLILEICITECCGFDIRLQTKQNRNDKIIYFIGISLVQMENKNQYILYVVLALQSSKRWTVASIVQPTHGVTCP